MDIVDFFSLYTLDYNLGSVFAMRQRWRQKGSFQMNVPRTTSCLLYFCGCAGIYRENGKRFVAPKGSVVYIPEGAVYKTAFTDFDDSPTDTILIEFGLRHANNNEHFCISDKIVVLEHGGGVLLDKLFNRAADEQVSPVVSAAALKSTAYQVLNQLSLTHRHENILSNRFSSIAKGIDYLEGDLRQEKTIQEISEMCYVSPAHFRRLFKEYAGVSPTEYRIISRIEYAKKLLSLGSMTTAEISREVGFEDPAYFCRIFKKRCGVSPGQYMLRSQTNPQNP